MKITKNYKLQYFFCVLAYATFAILRSRELFLEGRFFAEEGSVFWSYALSQKGLNMLQYVPVIQGYFCLNCNLQVYLSTLLPINYSPLFTVWSSFLISILPSFLFFKLADREYDNKSRIIISFVILFLPSLNLLEVLANSINSQVYLAICCVLILLYGLDRRKLLKLQYAILFISFLSSYYALILLPAFLIKYLLTKNIKTLWIVILGAICSVIQINVLYYSTNTNAIYQGKLQLKGGLEYLIEVLTLSFSLNFFGEKFYRNIPNELITLMLLTILLKVILNKKDKIAFLIIFVYTLELFLVIYGQAGSNFSQRYAVVTSTISFLLVIHLINKSKINNVVIFYFLLIGLLNFNTQGSRYFIECNEFCTTWSQQIKEVSQGNREYFVHWPIGEGEPYWSTNAAKPEPNPAPFQKNIIGSDYLKFYNITLKEVFLNNLENILSD